MSQHLSERSCGVLLHPSSLPSQSAIGDLGQEAYDFVDFLVRARQGIWQVLPLGPVGEANSPYDSTSAFAGNPLLISEHWLAEHGLLFSSDLEPPIASTSRTDFELARDRQQRVLRIAFDRFQQGSHSDLTHRFNAFRLTEAHWLADFILYQALRDAQSGAPWSEWPDSLAHREHEALERHRINLASDLSYHAFVQFLFSEQWLALRHYANRNGVRILGDIPIYVSLDSADVWAHQDLFTLGEDARPTVVAGVPPDYFSASGQLWGNPCYRWPKLAQTRYAWWIQRFRRALDLTDMVRVDHFRAFQAGWQVPADAETAIGGSWVAGPGITLFRSVEQSLGSLPIVVEDLGIITDDVTELRNQLGLPGMKVLQFAFGSDSANPYLPHNFDTNCVVYTGTHDNDTTIGWYEHLDAGTRAHVNHYLGRKPAEVNWSMIQLAYSSVASTAIVPVQDLLALGSEGRMNTPGTIEGNWEWRMRPGSLTDEVGERLRQVTDLYRRTSLTWR